MANPQDNAPPGFTSDFSVDASQDAGPFYPIPGGVQGTFPPQSAGIPLASLLGFSFPVVAVGQGTVTVRNDTLQFGIVDISISVSQLPAGVAPSVGMRVQFNTDGTVYLLAAGSNWLDGTGREDARKRRLDDLRREMGLLPALDAEEKAAAAAEAERNRAAQIREAFRRKFQPIALDREFVSAPRHDDLSEEEREMLLLAAHLLH